jgi:hypothetical protein
MVHILVSYNLDVEVSTKDNVMAETQTAEDAAMEVKYEEENDIEE